MAEYRNVRDIGHPSLPHRDSAPPELKHVQVRVPWHFSKSRCRTFFLGRVLLAGLSYRPVNRRPEARNVVVETKNPSSFPLTFRTTTPRPDTGITSHPSMGPFTVMRPLIMRVMMMMMVTMMAVMATLPFSSRRRHCVL